LSIKRNLFWSAIAAAVLLANGFATSPAAVSGRQALDLLLKGHYDEFNQLLTDDAKKLLTPEFLRDRVASEIAGFGTLEQVGEAETAKAGTNDLVSFPTRFSKTTVGIQLTMTAAGRVAGLHFRPASDLLRPVWARPAYSNLTLFVERPVTVGEDPWKLGGTMTVPVGKGPFAAIVLVHGAGPNDRDESILANRMFEDIAEGLSSQNVVVLRYDKRTRTYASQMSGTDYTLREETIEDAARAVALLRKLPEVDPQRIYVLGHSLGGYALPRIIAECVKQNTPVAGAVFLAAHARHIEDVGLEQAEFMMKDGGSPDRLRQLEMLKSQVALVHHLDPSKQYPSTLLGFPVVYFFDLKDYNPVAEAARLQIPLLFLQGERDFQVTMEDFGLWKAGLAGSQQASFSSYAALNHLFIRGEGPGSPAEYRKAGNVAPAVIDDITRWLSAGKL
jgi:pimeloyl-ACP methyl ester carboxylesterase